MKTIYPIGGTKIESESGCIRCQWCGKKIVENEHDI